MHRPRATPIGGHAAPEDLNFVNGHGARRAASALEGRHRKGAPGGRSLPDLPGPGAPPRHVTVAQVASSFDGRPGRAPGHLPVALSPIDAAARAPTRAPLPLSPMASRHGELTRSAVLEEWLEVFSSPEGRGRDHWNSLALVAEAHVAQADIFAETRALGDPNEVSLAVAFAILERASERMGPGLARVIQILRSAVYTNASAYDPPHARALRTENALVCSALSLGSSFLFV